MTTTSQPQTAGPGSPPTYSEVVDKTIKRSVGAGNGRVYHDIPGQESIIFRFNPKPGMDDKQQPWHGQMNIKCEDVPLLMREGFHWTAANIIREEGYIDNINPILKNLGRPNNTCTITRFWVLQDLQQPPRWTALLKVHAPGYDIVSGIRPENWTFDMVRCCSASGVLEKNIYFFDALNPRNNYNTIYDDMPLDGWWPWPKVASKEEKKTS